MVQIIKAAILNYIRNVKMVLFNVFFPVFLILILGLTLANGFESSREEESDIVEIIYLDEGTENSSEILDILKANMKDMNINLEEENDIEMAKQRVRVANTAFIHINGDKIEFYSNDKYLYESSIAYGIVKGVTNTYNANLEAYKVNPIVASNIKPLSDDETFKMESISQKKSPSARDYYGVAEIGLMIFYYFSLPMKFLKEEKKRNIKERIKLTGLSLRKYYIGTFIGYSVVAFCSLMISYLIANFILGVNYGTNLLALPLAALPFICMIIALGILLAILLKEEERAETIASAVVIPVMCFLGGAYVTMPDDAGSLLNMVTNVSPLRWFNKGLFRYIYGGDNEILVQWIIIGTVITLAMVLIIYLLGTREEYSHE